MPSSLRVLNCEQTSQASDLINSIFTGFLSPRKCVLRLTQNRRIYSTIVGFCEKKSFKFLKQIPAY